MKRFFTLIVPLLLAVAGCAVPAPTSKRVMAHAATADAAGMLIIVDVCVNYSPLDNDDYFVVSNARDGAHALQAATDRFLDTADVRVRSKLIPFACGALHGEASMPKRVADTIDGPVAVRPQPLWISPDVSGDAEYVAALQFLATHVFTSSLAAYGKDPHAKTANDDQVRQASALVAKKSGRSSLLYIGVTGNSLSSGKAFTFGAVRLVAGVAISVAIGPIYTVGGTTYGVVFVPGGPVDRRQMAAGLFDLKQGALVRSRVVGGRGDPMKPEVVADKNALNLLLGDLLLTTEPR